MKKIYIFLFLFFLFNIFFVKEVYGLQFYKYQNNPLNISLIDDYSYILQVDVYEKNNNGCFGIAAAKKSNESFYSLVNIESRDCVNWVMKKEVLRLGRDITNPRLFVDTNNQKILFFTIQDDQDFYRIYSTNCDNNLNCSNDVNLILNPNKNDYTEKNGYFGAKILRYQDKYYMFYGVWGSDGFKIRLAYSDNLQSWTKCQFNLISDDADGPFPLISDNSLFLFYHKSNSSGIKLAKANLPISCNMIFQDQGYQLIKGSTYDAKHLIFPSVLFENNDFKLFYSGLSSFNNWSLNLACTDSVCGFNLPTPTLIPSPTITPTPTPTKIPIIILPGFMGSWNKRAILHNEDVNYNDWKLAPFVKEYNGLINTLKNLGLKENEDFYVFAYDWRKPVLETVENLNSFINSHLSQTFNKFSLVGHSLGGLVARIYTQKYKDKVNKIISVGSPHQGVVQVYKPIEAGEIDRENTLLWLAQKMILILNKNTIESDRQTITNKFPVTYDLFPTFDLIKNKKNQINPISSLNVKNTLLNQFNQSINEIYDIFTAIYGEKDKNTPSEFLIDSPNLIDQVLGNYQDGYPIETHFDYGDYTVLTKSAKQDEDAEKLVFDHGEIITKKEAIKKILDLLGINYNEEKIVEGEKTNIARSLIFLIKSPARMSVNFNNNIYEENDGIIFIPNAETGGYQLNVQGTDFGQYQVIIGQISDNNDIWEIINGEITNNPPDQQIDTYFINYNNENSYSIFPTSTPTLVPTLTLTPTKIFEPINTPTNTPTNTLILSQTTNQSTASNNSNSSSTSNSNKQISSKPTPTPTLILFSKIDNETNKNLNNDNNGKILGEKTEKKEVNQLKNKKSNNFIYYSILGIIIFFIFLIFKMYNIFHDKIKDFTSDSNKK